MESSSIFGAEKMEPNDFENNERALVALRDDDAAAFLSDTSDVQAATLVALRDDDAAAFCTLTL